MFEIGDLVTTSDSMVWYFGFAGYYGDYVTDARLLKPKRSEGPLGLVVAVSHREPSGYRVTPSKVYRVKWLGDTDSFWDRQYYEEELKLVSMAERKEKADEE